MNQQDFDKWDNDFGIYDEDIPPMTVMDYVVGVVYILAFISVVVFSTGAIIHTVGRIIQ